MNHLFIILTVFVLLNCTTRTSDQANYDATSQPENELTDKPQKQPQPLELQPLDISFNSFLIEFCANEEFQLSRVSFPYEIKLFDYDDNVEIIKISKDKWQHFNLLDTAGIESRENDAFTQTTEIQENTATIKRRGIDNGIRVDYTFELRGGRWFLIGKSDSST